MLQVPNQVYISWPRLKSYVSKSRSGKLKMTPVTYKRSCIQWIMCMINNRFFLKPNILIQKCSTNVGCSVAIAKFRRYIIRLFEHGGIFIVPRPVVTWEPSLYDKQTLNNYWKRTYNQIWVPIQTTVPQALVSYMGHRFISKGGPCMKQVPVNSTV